jgi:hypothetical protein
MVRKLEEYFGVLPFSSTFEDDDLDDETSDSLLEAYYGIFCFSVRTDTRSSCAEVGMPLIAREIWLRGSATKEYIIR